MVLVHASCRHIQRATSRGIVIDMWHAGVTSFVGDSLLVVISLLQNAPPGGVAISFLVQGEYALPASRDVQSVATRVETHGISEFTV